MRTIIPELQEYPVAIDDFRGMYEVDRFGVVWSFQTGERKKLKPRPDKDGYLIVNLYKRR